MSLRRIFITCLPLAVACGPNSMRIRYDPIGSWSAIPQADWPNHADYKTDSSACTDSIRDILGDKLTVKGTFPDWKEQRTQGSLQFGDRTLDVELTHDVGAGASAQPMGDVDEELLESGVYVFEDGSVFLWAEFYTDRTMRVNTEHPDMNYCWTWFELE